MRKYVNLGWIGEDGQGVWIARDPQVALLDFPALWPVLAEWDSGLREMTPEDYRTKSAYQYTAKLHMAIAMARNEKNGNPQK